MEQERVDFKSNPALSRLLVSVCNAFGTTVEEILQGRRYRHVVDSRQCYFYLAIKLFPNATLKSLGDSLGRDHATVIHSKRQVEKRLEVIHGKTVDPEFKRKYTQAYSEFNDSSDLDTPIDIMREMKRRQRLVDMRGRVENLLLLTNNRIINGLT